MSSSFYQLRRVRTIRRSIPTSTFIQLINSFLISRIDYCNSLLAGLPACQKERIQSILNYAVSIIFGRRKYDQVTSFLMDNLDWLRVPQRVKLKSCLLICMVLHGQAPTYIRQFSTNNLILPISKTKFGNRSFSVAGLSA